VTGRGCRYLLIAGALAVLAGCDRTPEDLGPFTIQFLLDDRPESRCQSTSCLDHGMSCGAVFSLRIRDADDEEMVFADTCEEYLPAESVCGLGARRLPFFSIPARRLRIEAAAWRREVIQQPGEPLGCPEGRFDLHGFPDAFAQPQPAFGGAAYFDAASDLEVAMVPLACSDSLQLDAPECGRDPTTLLRVSVEDIETALDITSEQAQSLTVGAAAPRTVTDDDGNTTTMIDAGDTIALTLIDGPVPIFTSEVSRGLGDVVCAVIVDLTPQSTASVTCSASAPLDNPIDQTGALVSKPILDQILAAMDQVAFPSSGLVIGRVVDHTGAPLSQVAVTPSTGAIEYLSADRSSLAGSETSASGFFIARDVPFGTSLTALHLVDGRQQVGAIRTGLVTDKVSSVIVRMEAP
jgi:hypothetical protein